MSGSHKAKYLSKMLTGFLMVTAGVLAILYACFERTATDDWYFWGIVASVMLCFGLYFLQEAFVHKVKSDLIKKQKLRDQQKSPAE